MTEGLQNKNLQSSFNIDFFLGRKTGEVHHYPENKTPNVFEL